MKNKYPIKNNDKRHLKRKKGEYIRFDIFINNVNDIKIEKLNIQYKISIIENNKIIYLFSLIKLILFNYFIKLKSSPQWSDNTEFLFLPM